MRTIDACLIRQVLACVGLAALAACGGGGSDGGGTVTDPVTRVSGRVIDGYLVGAQVFWDCNDNFQIDEPVEPWVATTAGGQYSIAQAPSAACILRAVVPSWTVDESSGQTVGRIYRMSALAGNPSIISPVTTLITDGKYTLAQVQAMTGFTSPADVDYVAKGQAGIKDTNIAGVIAVGLMAVDGLVLAQDTQARNLTYRSLVDRIPADAFFVSTASVAPPSQQLQLLDGLPSWTPLQSTTPALELQLLDPALTGLCTNKLADGSVEPAGDLVCEQRKTFIRGALGLARRYYAISGATVDWSRIPVTERRALAAAETIPSNPGLDELRAELKAFITKVNADIEKARGDFQTAERIQLASSVLDLSYRAVDLGASVFEMSPGGKGVRLVSSKFKSVKAPLELKKKAGAFLSSAGKLKLKDYFTLIESPECALKMTSNVLATWAAAQDGPVDMPDEVVTYLFDTALCLVELVNAPGKSPADRLRKKEVFQKVVSATLGGIDFSLESIGTKWTSADQKEFWAAVDLALDLATTASDTLEAPGVSAALKLVKMASGSLIASASGAVAGTVHQGAFAQAVVQANQGLDAFLHLYGRLFFAGRVDPYIGVDVLLDICSKNGVSIGRAWSPVTQRSGRAYAQSTSRIQALGTVQRVTAGSAITLAPGQRFFGAGSVYRYAWDFGDGSATLVTATPDEVSHTYAVPGAYVVTLRTSSAGGKGIDNSDGESYEASVYADIQVDSATSAEVKALVDSFDADGTAFAGMAKIGSDVYVASVQQDRLSILRNGDNTPFYKSSLMLTKITGGAVQWQVPVASNVYMASDATQFSQTGVAVARAGDAILIASNGFVGSGYGMKFGVYKVALADRAVSYTAHFALANVGWFPWFSADDSVNHFAFAGYLRCLNAQCGAAVQPTLFITESQNKVLASVGLAADLSTQSANLKVRILAQLKAWLGL